MGTTAIIDIYEIDGTEIELSNRATITIRSHKRHSDYVTLQCKSGVIYTVLASKLKKAIDNATNN